MELRRRYSGWNTLSLPWQYSHIKIHSWFLCHSRLFVSHKMACFDETTRKRKAVALLIWIQLREHGELLQAQHLRLQVRQFINNHDNRMYVSPFPEFWTFTYEIPGPYNSFVASKAKLIGCETQPRGHGFDPRRGNTLCLSCCNLLVCDYLNLIKAQSMYLLSG